MLSRLFIKNYALIDNLDISFDKGLNIITGETGAGKSILMGALGLILGNRAEGKQFFDEDKKCIIEGYFAVEAYRLEDFFKSLDLEYEKETIIRRELSSDGKSRAFVNDSPVTLNVLKTLGERLVDIHSQHATMQVNTEDFQLFVLDSVANNINHLEAYASAFLQLRQLDKKLKNLKEEVDAANAELDYNQFLFDELEKVDVQAEEVQLLEDEQKQLENAEEIKKSLLATNYLLTDSEQDLISILKDAIQNLQVAGRFVPEAEELGNRLQSTYIEIKDIANEVEQLERTVVLDEQRLDTINSRLSSIYVLLKKHRVDTEKELIDLKSALEEKLQMALNQDELLENLTQERHVQLQQVLVLADVVTANRNAAVPLIEKSVQETLAQVGMPNAQLKIQLDKVDQHKLNSKGQDTVQFLFSANKGQALQQIHRVASGGELSRVMLAIKSLVAKSSALPTIIFDEIDTGISGEVALRVGEVMDHLSGYMQVIAISHLPQIASKGNAHFKVYKEDQNDKTRSNIQLLDEAQRVQEIAQMLSGSNPGEAAVQHAKELLQ